MLVRLGQGSEEGSYTLRMHAGPWRVYDGHVWAPKFLGEKGHWIVRKRGFALWERIDGREVCGDAGSSNHSVIRLDFIG